MPKLLQSFLRILTKSLKVFGYAFLALFILVNAFILLSGRTYLYKGIASTYLIGKAAPTIYDLDVFYNSTITASGKNEWPTTNDYNTQVTENKYKQVNDSLETKAFIVIKNDSILFEHYFDEHSQTTVSNSYSAAKTVVALLIGVAVEEGKIKSIDEPVGNYIPEFKSNDRNEITIRDLLLMASGLDWTESGKNPLSDNAESYYGTDLYGHVTRQNRITEPGKKFVYQSGNSQLLGFVLEKATGMSISEYTQEKLWSKLGMTSNAYWSLDKENGDEKAFCCLYATARDFARIAALIGKNGKWNGTQVIPEWYMEEMKFVPHNMGTKEGVKNHQYGLHLWVYEAYSSPLYYCRGIKGQYLISIPEENVVIVRIGSERKDSYDVSDFKSIDNSNILLIGHPKDLPDYINFAESILKQRK